MGEFKMKYKLLIATFVVFVIVGLPIYIQFYSHHRFNNLKNYYRNEVEKHLPLGSTIDEVVEFLKDKDGTYGLYIDEPFRSTDHSKFNFKTLIEFTSDERILNLNVLTLYSTLEVIFLFDDNNKLSRVVYMGIA